ncbi:MAG: cytochrome C [Verrucomicrobiae bacterium]|nr:cytochrome C [Verrucomicrobiae bacterium]
MNPLSPTHFSTLEGLRRLSPILLAVVCLLLNACADKEAVMGRGFVLPSGDIEQGQAAFVSLKCNLCHSVVGTELPGIETGKGHVLGGEILGVKTYGELVTAVINPNHDISPQYQAKLADDQSRAKASPMPPFNESMTVRQLIDIVTFLHSRYEKLSPEFTPVMYPMP